MNRNDIVLFGPRGPSVEEIQSALDERLAGLVGAASVAADDVAAIHPEETVFSLRTEVADLGERLGSIEGAVSEIQTAVGEVQPSAADIAEAQANIVETLREELSEGSAR